MSKLIDSDTLVLDTEWSEYYDEFMSYSQHQIRDAGEVKAIPIDKIKKAREEIRAESYSEHIAGTDCDDILIVELRDVLAILDKLIAESEEK